MPNVYNQGLIDPLTGVYTPLTSYNCFKLTFLFKDPKVLTDVPQVTNYMTPIVLDGLNCRGNEANLGQCGHEPVVEGCSHSDDARAFCTNIIGKQH